MRPTRPPESQWRPVRAKDTHLGWSMFQAPDRRDRHTRGDTCGHHLRQQFGRDCEQDFVIVASRQKVGKIATRQTMAPPGGREAPYPHRSGPIGSTPGRDVGNRRRDHPICRAPHARSAQAPGRLPFLAPAGDIAPEERRRLPPRGDSALRRPPSPVRHPRSYRTRAARLRPCLRFVSPCGWTRPSPWR